jgi:23S rRNA (guanosine2251-2'-O)-methyltransferase
LVALDRIADPRNLGAILRSAAAFGAAAVILPERGSAALGALCAKAASGGLDVVPVVGVVNLARALGELKAAGVWTIGLALDGTERLDALPDHPRRALVVGAEATGLRRLVAAACDHRVRLTIDPRIDSLNVAVAAGIALHALARREPAP